MSTNCPYCLHEFDYRKHERRKEGKVTIFYTKDCPFCGHSWIITKEECEKNVTIGSR